MYANVPRGGFAQLVDPGVVYSLYVPDAPRLARKFARVIDARRPPAASQIAILSASAAVVSSTSEMMSLTLPRPRL